MKTGLRVPKPAPEAAWWLVLCLVGLDYFSTLAYLPSLAVAAAGTLAPLAALLVGLLTLLAALPVYWYVVGRSFKGRGGTGVIEEFVPGWAGKSLILLLLAFAATDFVVTQNLSVADAAVHVQGNALFRDYVEPFAEGYLHPKHWFAHPWWQRFAHFFDRQLTLSLLLSLVSFSAWAYWRRGFTEGFYRTAFAIVSVYLALNAVVIGSGASYLLHEGNPLLHEWWTTIRQTHALDGDRVTAGRIWSLLALVLVAFPHFALGLSGFELSMAVAPLVKGAPGDTPQRPRGRVRNTRKLMATAGALMAISLFGAVLVSTVLIPHEAFQDKGPAVHRALAYLAHGGELAGGRPASVVNAWFGPEFGLLYDAWTVLILCLAGSSVMIALRDFVPEYLNRFGMELDWAERLGVQMRFFNLIVLVVTVLFRARIEALQWVYATSVLVLLSSATLSALLLVRQERLTTWLPRLAQAPLWVMLVFLWSMVITTIFISRAGLEIALAFGLGIVLTSFLSRWIRSTELRFQGFDFADETASRRWLELCEIEFQVLVPHRPGLHSRQDKVRTIRQDHRLAADVPIILVEAELGDTSDFYHRPLMNVYDEHDYAVIALSRCVSISHSIAAIALEMAKVGQPPEIHSGWSDETPLAANLNFLLFGQGNVPWMVRELIRKVEPDPERRPRIIVG